MSVKVEGARRAEFKEIARSIIARDRTARKNGWSQNTIGEIERALVAAYISGRSETTIRPAASVADFVNWIEIPPRARDALWFMSVAISGSGHDGEGFEVELVKREEAKGPRWHEVARVDDTRPGFSTGAIRPLVRLGLMEDPGQGGDNLRMTPLGVRTCLEFWRRWNEGDKSLPVMSIRS